MKRYLVFLFAVLCGCTGSEKRSEMSLAGEWSFRIDSLDQGIKEGWYLTKGAEMVKLPGSMAENGKGNEVTIKTDWTGDILDSSYFKDEKYSKYRETGNFKIPFWLKPAKYYKGVAWYQKEINVPAGWEKKNIMLFLERPHWETTLFVNGEKAGTENSLATAHQYDISNLIKAGKNLISIRVDNRMVIPVGIDSHSVSDQTQTNWNGITGEISLRSFPPVHIRWIQIYPDVAAKQAKIIVTLSNINGRPFDGKLILKSRSLDSINSYDEASVSEKITIRSTGSQFTITYPFSKNMKTWDEFNPSLYKLTVLLKNRGGKIIDSKSEMFGMRNFKVKGKRFFINDNPVFLRGTTECCVFPLTGYPPADLASWIKVIKICKEYGLNHMRFHSYCPPDAAFEAADRLGFYFHVECSSWANHGTSIGDGGSVDRFIYDESERIMNIYGNHPSFCMLAYGNEPAGINQKSFLGKLLEYWKSKDNRHVYTSAAGWPVIPESDYALTPSPRIQQWGQGLKSIINAFPPQTEYDFRDIVSDIKGPVVSHETGQWCVYPDFTEIGKYTGVLKATNLEIFSESLNENGMGSQAEDFFKASGKLQAICYKAEIEAALRTPDFAGFQMLQLHDFPGQGTALVGVLNSFFQPKRYINAEEFRNFCNETVPLARMKKLIYNSADTFRAGIEIYHFGEKALLKPEIKYRILSSRGDTLLSGFYVKEKIDPGSCSQAGSVTKLLNDLPTPCKYKLEVSIDKTPFKNSWEFWVYPSAINLEHGDVYMTDILDSKAESQLRKGKPVLLLIFGKISRQKGAEIEIGFSSIFWNTSWTGNQAPHTLGILCDPSHPVFKDFTTEYHSNWQWWDPVMHSQVMMLDGFPAEVKPLIQPIDTWYNNRRLALAFESKTGGGRLLVCSIDLKNIPGGRIVSKQLLCSMLNYMNSPAFNPNNELDIRKIKALCQP